MDREAILDRMDSEGPFWAADEIERLREQLPKWVSVEDRLPEDDNTVIVRGEDEDDPWQPVWYDADSYSDGMWGGVSSPQYTHWMPLPSPPEGEQ